MRTTIALATFLVVGAGAVGVSALDLKGSDTLEGITRLLLTDSSLDCGGTGNTPVGDLVYVGSGSTNGESQIVTGAQQIAPMSRFLATGATCGLPNTPDGGGIGPSESTAEGIAFALDGLAIVSSIANAGAVACNGTTGTCTPGQAKGLAFGTVISVPGYTCPTAAQTAPNNPADPACANGSYRILDSKDALRLIYFGLDHDFKAAADRNCGSNNPALTPVQANAGLVRAALVENWGNIFKDPGALTVPGPATSPERAWGNCAGCTRLWHAFRRNDESGTTDTFVSLLGRTAQLTAGGTATIAIPSINQASRRSLFCNTRQAAGAQCGVGDQGGFDVVTNPNSLPFRQLGFNLNESSPSNAEPPAPPTAPGGPARPAPTHVNPKPGWDFPDSEFGTIGNAPYFTDFQDFDCIRRQCSTPAGGTQQEQVCSARGDLGLILPIWDPPAVTALQDPFATAACAGRWQGVRAPRCNGTAPSICPNGERPVGAVCAANNPGTCLQPYVGVAPNYDFRCINNANNVYGGQRRVDGRVYNLHCHSNDATSNPQFPFCQVTRANPDAAGTLQVDMVGAYYRIHQGNVLATARPNHFVLKKSGDFAPLAAGVAAESTPGGGSGACNPGTLGTVSATRIIGCLMGADRCAMGFAGREASTMAGADAIRVDDILPDPLCVREPEGSANRYPLSRKLYVNTTKGFENVAGNELKLAKCFADRNIVDPKVILEGFIPLTASTADPTLCEDFNELTACGAGSNVNACANNGPVAPIPTNP